MQEKIITITDWDNKETFCLDLTLQYQNYCHDLSVSSFTEIKNPTNFLKTLIYDFQSGKLTLDHLSGLAFFLFHEKTKSSTNKKLKAISLALADVNFAIRTDPAQAADFLEQAYQFAS